MLARAGKHMAQLKPETTVPSTPVLSRMRDIRMLFTFHSLAEMVECECAMFGITQRITVVWYGVKEGYHMKLLTIGALAASAGVHVETVRFYQRKGLGVLRPNPRNLSVSYKTIC
ncbi:MAG: MerR family transcriptional regulator [Acidithiobacillus sp.]